MKTKTILISICLILTLGFLSFKNASSENDSKAILLSIANGKGDNQGFIITYGDGKIEKRKFNIKALDVDNWIEMQSKLAEIVNELKEKGYHYAGTHTFMLSVMVFEKN